MTDHFKVTHLYHHTNPSNYSQITVPPLTPTSLEFDVSGIPGLFTWLEYPVMLAWCDFRHRVSKFNLVTLRHVNCWHLRTRVLSPMIPPPPPPQVVCTQRLRCIVDAKCSRWRLYALFFNRYSSFLRSFFSSS